METFKQLSFIKKLFISLMGLVSLPFILILGYLLVMFSPFICMGLIVIFLLLALIKRKQAKLFLKLSGLSLILSIVLILLFDAILSPVSTDQEVTDESTEELIVDSTIPESEQPDDVETNSLPLEPETVPTPEEEDLNEPDSDLDSSLEELPQVDTPSVETPQEPVVQAPSITSTETTIHFIDTGNSDSVLIENNGQFALIDSGDRDDDATMKAYLKAQGVTRLEYFISTHYHADHIGGADTMVREFEVGTTFVPNGSATTQVYRDFINALSSKGLAASVPLEGASVSLGNATLTFYNTKGDLKDENNNSLVVLLQSGNKKALFTGDAESSVETSLTQIGKVDVFKAGHHGSSTSNTSSFLNRIKPDHIVIMVGANNKYGHPHQEVLERFKTLGSSVYRTDEQGTIVVTLSDTGVSVNQNAISLPTGTSQSTPSVSETPSTSAPLTGKEETAADTPSTEVTPTQPSTPQVDIAPTQPESTPSTEETTPLKKYDNCKQLNVDYPKGINKWDHPELYDLNSGRDRDKDGYACER